MSEHDRYAYPHRLLHWLAWAILGLLVLHIAGALFHWLVKQDGIMKRMSLF
ncbi:cytochrome b/b6 domain-containing protein [Halomonas sp.]|jgi:cytochrome b561|uniref:cytochrome b/b6 domain-containing protein n=1 Tax=Halomonas sp. TaxID=1486246 RepID=UPI003565143F